MTNKHSIKYKEAHGLLIRQQRGGIVVSDEPILPILDIVVKLKETNPEGVPKSRWHSENKERVNKTIRAWQKANPEKRRLHARPSEHRRKSRLKGAIGSFTALEWANLLITHDNRCAYCKKRKKLTVDHIIPLSKGGTNNIDNIVPACGSCNSSKRDKLWDVQPSLKLENKNIKGTSTE